MSSIRLKDLSPKLQARLRSTGVPADDGKPTRQRYGNVFTKVDGITFRSAKESRRYSLLKMLERAGKITALELQPRFPLIVTDKATGRLVEVGAYVADFAYTIVDPRSAPVQGYAAGDRPVEDVKSEVTAVDKLFVLKRALFEALYGQRLELV